MKGNSVVRLGSMAAILLGVARLLASILYLLLPPEQRAAMPGATLLPSVAKESTLLISVFWVEVIVGVLGVAFVPALSSLVRATNEGWVRWSGNLAIFGYALSAVGYLRDIDRLPVIAAAFANGDAATKAAILPLWKQSLDLQGIWGYGVVGLWILVVSLLAMRDTTFPKLLTYVGLLFGLMQLLVPLVVILKNQELILLIVGLGVIVAPIFYIWSGLMLQRAAGARQ